MTTVAAVGHESNASPVWDHDVVVAVRQEHEEELRGRNLRNLLERMRTNVYQGGSLRCVPELIQNAQDEGADSVIFVLDKDSIHSHNNGRPFQDYQVQDICSIAQSHKADSQIGWMGLGFKSVFTVSDHPQVTSGHYNFLFEDLILPKPVDSIPDSKWLPVFTSESGAWFRMPLKDSKARARDAILKGWRSISPHILLFLPGMRRVQFVDAAKDVVWAFEKRLLPDGTVELTRSDTRRTTRWKIFKRLYEGMSQEVGHKKHTPAVHLAFPVKQADCSNEPLYCYLPTGAPTGLNFLVHADFGLSISREGLLDDEFNRLLLESAGDLAARSVAELAAEDSFADRILDFVPADGEVKDPKVGTLEESMIANLKAREFLKTDPGKLAKPRQLVFADDRVKELVTPPDLRRLYKRPMRFVRSNLTASVRNRSVLKRLGIQQVSTPQIIALLFETSAGRRREPDWFLDCYDHLYDAWRSLVTQADSPEPNTGWIEDLKQNPSILTTSRRMVPPSGRSAGEIVSYPHGQGATELERTFRRDGLYVVHRHFWPTTLTQGARRKRLAEELEAKRQRVKTFLCDALGVRRQADVLAVVEDVILPRLEHAENLALDEAIRLTDYVRRNLAPYQSRAQRSSLAARLDTTRRIRERIRIRCYEYSGRRRTARWRRPEELYLGEEYSGDNELETLLKGITGVVFTSGDYAKVGGADEFKGRGRSRVRIPSWQSFFESIGVRTKLAVERLSLSSLPSNHKAFGWLDWPAEFPTHYRYDPPRHRLDDWSSEDLSRLLQALTSLPKNSALRKATILWRHLDVNWTSTYSKFLTSQYQYYYGSWRSVPALPTSTFREQLRNAQWVPSEADGRLSAPTILYHPRNKSLLGSSVIYSALECRRPFAEAVGLTFELTVKDVMDRLQSIRDSGAEVWQSEKETVAGLYQHLAGMRTDGRLKEGFESKPLILAWNARQLEWFAPDQCIWADHQDDFGDLFGYLAVLYPAPFQEFFETVGAHREPTLKFCLNALLKLHQAWKQTNPPDRVASAYSQIATKILLLMERIYPREGPSELGGQEKPLDEVQLPTQKGRFIKAPSMFVPDFREAQEIFGSALSYLDLTCDPSSVAQIVNWLGIPSLLSATRLRLITADSNTVHPATANRFRELVQVLRHVVSFKFPDILTTDAFASRMTAMENIEPYESDELRVELWVRAGPRKIVHVQDRRVYIDITAGKLWVKPGRLLTSDLAPEIARLFGAANDRIRLLAKGLLDAGFDDEQLEAFLREEGVPISDVATAVPEGPPPSLRPIITTFPQPTEEQEDKGEAPTSPQSKQASQPVAKQLHDPDRFFVSSNESPSKSGHPKSQKFTRPPRRPKDGAGKEARPRPQGKISLNTIDKERAAINLAMQVEEREGRKPYDVHESEGRYDIFSDVPGKDTKIEIEVKMARPGEPFVMQPNQWKEAREKREDYYVYLVSGLLQGEQPVVYAIQDPANTLFPAAPTRVDIPKWEPDSATRYTFEERRSKKPSRPRRDRRVKSETH